MLKIFFISQINKQKCENCINVFFSTEANVNWIGYI